MLGGPVLLSFFYAVLSGIVFYTPVGVPFLDQHAFFFTFLIIFLCCLAVRSKRRVVRKCSVFFIPIVTIIGFLSKQIPTIFGVFFVAAIILVAERKRILSVITLLIVGTVFMVLLLGIISFVLGSDIELLKVYMFEIPRDTGMSRFRWLFANPTWIWDMAQYMATRKLIYFPILIVFLSNIGVLIYIILARLLLRKDKPSWQEWMNTTLNGLFPLVLSLGLILICLLFITISDNQFENGIPFLFISVALVHLYFLKTSRPKDIAVSPALMKKQPIPIAAAISLFLYTGSLFSAYKFNVDVNATRLVSDLIYKKNQSEETGQKMPDPFSFMVWAAPPRYHGTPSDFAHIADFFQRNPGNFFLVGDSSILYGLTGRPSISPALWFDAGQTLPLPTSRFFSGFEDRLSKSFQKYQVRYVVLEQSSEIERQYGTWRGVNLAYLRGVYTLVQRVGTVRERFGPFTIIELIMPTKSKAEMKS
jgi:hypothetical protein